MTTSNSDGQPVLPDSATSQPEPPLVSPENAAVAEATQLLPPSPSIDAKDFLKSLGISKGVALRMMANGKTEAYLNTKVTARVYMVHQVNSAEVLMAAQRKASLLGADKSIEPRTRAACLDVVAKCAMALARLSEVAMTTARNLDSPEESEKTSVISPTQNNFFGFPPVAGLPRTEEAKPAINGNGKVVEV